VLEQSRLSRYSYSFNTERGGINFVVTVSVLCHVSPLAPLSALHPSSLASTFSVPCFSPPPLAFRDGLRSVW
jgi:hypothetical protein